MAHLKVVHDRKSRHGKVSDGNMQKGTAPAQEHRFGFSTINGLNPVSPMKEDKHMLQGGQQLQGKPLGMTSSQKPLTDPETMDSDDWSPGFGERSSILPDYFDSVDGLGSSIYTDNIGTFENMHAGCLGEQYELLPHDNPPDLGAGDQQGFYSESQIPEEGTEMNGLPIESDDRTKRKMISAIQEKRAELKRIDEQIRMLEELKVRARTWSSPWPLNIGTYDGDVEERREGRWEEVWEWGPWLKWGPWLRMTVWGWAAWLRMTVWG